LPTIAAAVTAAAIPRPGDPERLEMDLDPHQDEEDRHEEGGERLQKLAERPVLVEAGEVRLLQDEAGGEGPTIGASPIAPRARRGRSRSRGR